MLEKITAVAALFAIMLGPETICNVLHIGEYPVTDKHEIVEVETCDMHDKQDCFMEYENNLLEEGEIHDD